MMGSHLSRGTLTRTQVSELSTQATLVEESDNARPAAATSTRYDDTKESVVAEDYVKAAPPPPVLVAPEAKPVETTHIESAEASNGVAAPLPVVEPVVAPEPPSTDRSVSMDEAQVQQAHEPILAPAATNVNATAAPSTIEEESHQEPQIIAAPTPAAPVRSDKPKFIETKQLESAGPARVHSASPARTAHFATGADQLAVKHEPPPRSLSPRKSALKFASPPRGASPSDDSSEASGWGPSMAAKDDSAAARKKAFRVSFDDGNTTVIGESTHPAETDSPLLPSPQAKKPWHSIVSRYNKRDSVTLDEEETMTPRPALPLFGSVREKKSKEPEERPLVRPAERSTWSPPPAAALLPPTGPDAVHPADVGPSSDVAIGSILAQEQASSKNEANISKYREPLPPVVTSMEGDGHFSDDSESSEDEADVALLAETPEYEGHPAETTAHEADEITELPGIQEHAAAEPVAASVTETTQIPTSEPIPEISISQASPMLQRQEVEELTPKKTYFDIPGGFPEDDETPPAVEPSPALVEKAAETPETPVAAQKQATPEVASDVTDGATTSRTLGDEADHTPSPPMNNIQEDREASENDSIYSDAYEDMSEVEDEGFMSLDAVLSTPVKPQASPRVEDKKVADVSQTPTKEPVPEPSASAAPARPLSTLDDWAVAKAYWRSLSFEKRRQLETEALSDGADEADLRAKPKSKKKKKKVVNGAAVKSESEPARHPDRVYQIQPGTKWSEESSQRQPRPAYPQEARPKSAGKLAKSMRGAEAPPPPASMRRSMRSAEPEPVQPAPPTGGLKKSLRPSSVSGPGEMRQRPATSSGRPASYHPTGMMHGSRPLQRSFSDEMTPTTTTLAAASQKPTLTRRGSDDSESSFTRSKATKGDGFGFKRSMRATAQQPRSPPETTKNSSSRFSLRSLSPAGSAFRRNSMESQHSGGMGGGMSGGMGGRMRQSLRNDAPAETSSNRLSMFGRSSAKKSQKKKGNANAGASRFGDSSDEDEGAQTFRSRFVESSDEEDAPAPAPPTKTDGFPKSMRSGQAARPAATRVIGVPVRSDSPDLPDSDDEIIQPKRDAAPNGKSSGGALTRSGSGRGNLANPAPQGTTSTDATGPGRPGRSRRGSFMSILRRKKDVPEGKISRDVTESAARRDTKLERSTEQLVMMRTTSSSRLQKRQPSWPLPDGAANDDDDGGGREDAAAADDGEKRRPVSAHGGFGRRNESPPPPVPPLGRHDSSPVVMGAAAAAARRTADADDVGGGTPKKKKFGALRRMFKLDD